MKFKNPVIAALDVDTESEALQYVQKMGAGVGAYKLGPRLTLRYGQSLIQEIARTAPVFVDSKFLDIPSTMVSAVRASFEAGATLSTVHAWGGPEALAQLANLERELNRERPFLILVVTILTSFDSKTLPPPQSQFPIDQQVESLVRMARDCGLRGIVCSPQELQRLKPQFPEMIYVTPGVRPLGSSKGDQKRVATPQEALSWGASALVIGRPLLEHSNPLELISSLANP